MEIMWAGIMAVAGWIIAYLFARQIIFDAKIAYPTIKKMNAAKEDLINKNATNYTTVSVILCSVILAIASALIIGFFHNKLYILIPFFGGAVVCVFMIYSSVKASNRKLFDSFCSAYYRFVADDELRTAMFNLKPSQMKLRLHDMNVSTSFIPVFDKEEN